MTVLLVLDLRQALCSGEGAACRFEAVVENVALPSRRAREAHGSQGCQFDCAATPAPDAPATTDGAITATRVIAITTALRAA